MRCYRYFLVFALVLAVGIQVGAAARPIDVGSRKQLFIDHKFIAAGRGVQLTMNPPIKINQPVLTGQQPWEGEAGAMCGQGGAILKENGKIRFWGAGKAMLPMRDAADGPVQHLGVYCESTDGIHFVKPDPSLYAYDETKAEIGKHGLAGLDAIWVDPNAPPSQRYKSQGKFVVPRDPDDENRVPVFRIYASPDGYQWTLFSEQQLGKCDTQSIMFWDEAIRKYLLYTRHTPFAGTAQRYRTVRRLESADMLSWENETVVMQADETDLAIWQTPTPQPPVDYYGGCVFKYPENSVDGVYIMMSQAYWHWQRRPLEQRYGANPDRPFPFEVLAPATLDVRLAASRDGIHFERLGGRKPFIGLGLEGTFCSKRTWALPNPIRMGDELWIYYYGTNKDHDGFVDPKSPGIMSAIDRAILRLDGFVSADADYTGGEIVTPLIKFSGKRLELNFDGGAGGSVRVELLDENDKPIEGYSGTAAEALYGNSVRLPVRWGDRQDVSPLAGKPIKMRLTMRDCKLYAFQFVE